MAPKRRKKADAAPALGSSVGAKLLDASLQPHAAGAVAEEQPTLVSCDSPPAAPPSRSPLTPSLGTAGGSAPTSDESPIPCCDTRDGASLNATTAGAGAEDEGARGAASTQELRDEMQRVAQEVAMRLNQVAGRRVHPHEVLRSAQSHMIGDGRSLELPGASSSTGEEQSGALRRVALRQQIFAPKLVGHVPDQTLEAVAGSCAEGDAQRTLLPSICKSHSPTNNAQNEVGAAPAPSIRGVGCSEVRERSITSTRGPMLRPSERALRDATWALSSATGRGANVRDSLGEKEAELALTLSEWRAVERDFSTHRAAYEHAAQLKQHLRDLNAQHRSTAVRMRQEIKSTQQRLATQEHAIIKLHSAITARSNRLHLLSEKRSEREMALLAELGQLNAELAEVRCAREKEEHDAVMANEPRIRRIHQLQRECDTFDGPSYVQALKEQQQAQLRARAQLERTASLVVEEKGDGVPDSHRATTPPDGDSAEAPTPPAQPLPKASPPWQQEVVTWQTTKAARPRRDASPAAIHHNKTQLEAFLSGGSPNGSSKQWKRKRKM